ncbi:hypothetical protein QQY66_01135 [Streptomyces sp. DG2A-72]|nr:hypothetical protein [Streptomyces sp. DG2A-72]MDO0930368.1 hypothetical protein [Streptomyces sp. DG2A-72]
MRLASGPENSRSPRAARVLPVADAYEVGRPLIKQILTGNTQTGCC